MKKFLKTHLFSSFILGTLLYQIAPVQACPVIDLGNIPTIAAGAITSQSIASTGTEVVAKEETSNETRSGNASCSNSPSNKSTELTSKTYEYLKKNIDGIFKSEYISPQKDVKTALETLKEKFFTSTEETEDDKEDDKEDSVDKIKNRMKYAAEVASEAYALSQQIRPLYQQDMQALKAASGKGCNQTQSNAMLNRNMKAQIKMLAAQIIIQIVQMEVDTVQQFIKEPPVILTIKTDGATTASQGGKK